MDEHSELDNVIWHALTSVHGPLAKGSGRGSGLARRFPADVSPLAGMGEFGPEAFADLRGLLEVGETVALFTTQRLEVPGEGGWKVVQERFLNQMICEEIRPGLVVEAVELGEADVEEMLALTALTKPGPFLQRTRLMGRYFGVRSEDGKLVAMTGERLRLDRYTEVSAVCTHPEHRGRGLGEGLVRLVAGRVKAEGKTPILHVLAENPARGVYERVGFRLRRELQLTVITVGSVGEKVH